MNHDQAERLLSARIDGERLSTRSSAALEQHLEKCAECRAFERGAYRLREAARFEVAPAVPDLVDEVMTAVGAEAGRPRPRLRVVRPGCPCLVEVGHSRFCLRAGECCQIFVRPLGAAS